MLRLVSATLLLLTPIAVHAQAAELSLEHRMLLRCAATVAMVADRQQAGDPATADYPDMRERGREFFIRASVRVMDEAGASREQVQSELLAAAQDINTAGTLDQMMPVCLPLVPETR